MCTPHGKKKARVSAASPPPCLRTPRHSLDSPPLPFHQVLDASLKKRREKGGSGGGEDAGTPGGGGAGADREPGLAVPLSPDGPSTRHRLLGEASRPGRRLTFRIRRLMMDSAAKTRSPTADSSILLSSTHSP